MSELSFISKSPTLADYLKNTHDLPVISSAALEVMRTAQSSSASANSLAEVLEKDPALSARVLRLANSSFFGLSRHVYRLNEAVLVVGMKNVRCLAAVAASYTWLEKPLVGYEFGPQKLWTHSYHTALAAQLVAERSGRADSSLAFIAGLLHEIGKVAMSVWLEPRLSECLTSARDLGIDVVAAERTAFGFDHLEASALLANRWNLPESICQALFSHPNPAQLNPVDAAADALHVGHSLALALESAESPLGVSPRSDVLERLQLTEADADGCLNDLAAKIEGQDDVIGALAA